MVRSRLVLATLLVLACAACSEHAATRDPVTSPSPTTSARTTPAAPQSSVPPELASYTNKQRSAYRAAVAQYDAFASRNDQFYGAGKTTIAAKRFYQRYAVDWSTAWGNLAQIASNHVTVRGSTKTVWTKPKSIELDKKVDVVVLRRCLDESGRIVKQNGKRLDQPQLKHSHVYTIRMEKRPGEERWRSGIAKQGQTC